MNGLERAVSKITVPVSASRLRVGDVFLVMHSPWRAEIMVVRGTTNSITGREVTTDDGVLRADTVRRLTLFVRDEMRRRIAMGWEKGGEIGGVVEAIRKVVFRFRMRKDPVVGGLAILRDGRDLILAQVDAVNLTKSALTISSREYGGGAFYPPVAAVRR